MLVPVQEDEGDGDDTAAAFPRWENQAPARKTSGQGGVFLRVHQRTAIADGRQKFEVRPSAEDGHPEIPLAVSATTVGSWFPKDVLLRSPWLARCLDAPEGSSFEQPLGEDEDGEVHVGEGHDDSEYRGSSTAVTCRRVTIAVLELGLPRRGPGRLLLSPKGLLECLELYAEGAPALSDAVKSASVQRLVTFLLWAVVLELRGLSEACHTALARGFDTAGVALVLACGHAMGDATLLRLCYWRLREVLCASTGPPKAWLDGHGPVQLSSGLLAYRGAGRTSLNVLKAVLEEDLAAKTRRWLSACDGYTLCRLHRIRSPAGGYPHVYELRLDHSDELLLSALREDEQSACRLFEHGAASPETSEHCEAFLGTVTPNFWGTAFELGDSGTDVEALTRRAPHARGLPLRQRRCLCKIGYETNILGDSPRRITVDFERDGSKYHMENVQPRWDKKLNSYALPFFGRVKKASAKNFQLVVDGDHNTIFLMFGKISKDVFCLDFRSPLALLDSMAIAVAAMAKKRAVS
mmetsp:Transcript_77250/g.179134  ORF Transcript_77250/g.179134 Transcript_77250/m.179134 type:complete len:522 (-) Transcript_77250:99-1664(-)